MNWCRLFPIIFLFSCVDGFISNWLYPAKLPFILKDIFILIVYIFFFITREPEKKWVFEFKSSVGSRTWYLAITLMLFGILQMFNPGVPGIPIAILGYKVMFFYWPLAVLAYAYVDSIDCLKHFMKTVVYFSIPICLFAIYQFFQGPDFMVRVFGEGFKRAIVMAGGGREEFLRVFGTFASTGQLSAFLIINLMFILGLLFSSGRRFEKLTMIGCLILNYITILSTGSRGSILLLAMTTFLFVILCRWLWRTFFIILLLSVSFGFGFNYLGKSVIQRFQSLKDIEMIRHRTIETTRVMLKTYIEEHPFGRGMGTASKGSRHFYKEAASDIELVENYPSKLQCELGIIGLVLFYLLLLSLTIHWFRHWFKLIDRNTYVLISALSSFCLVMFFYTLFGSIDSPPTAIFLWAEVGMVAKLARLQSDDQYPPST